MDTAERLLREAREYILHKANRHDLNWRDGHGIIAGIDAHLSSIEAKESAVNMESVSEFDAELDREVAAPTVQSEMPEEPWQPEIFYLSREQYSGSQPATWLSDWRRWRDYAEKLRSLLAQREEIIDGLKVERDMLYAELARGKK